MHTACRLSPTPGKWFLVGISDSEAGYRRQGIRHFYVTQEDSVKDLPGKGLTDIGSSVGKGNGKETLGRYRIGSSQLLTAHSVGCVCERWGQVALLGLFTGTRSCSTLQLRCLGLFPGTTFLACSATLAPWCSVPPSP